MAEAPHASGSGKSASPSAQPKGATLNDRTRSSISAGNSMPSARRTMWDFATDEITATVLAELRL